MSASGFLMMPEISLYEISGITTKAPCEAARVGARHVHIEISAFVMRTFALRKKMSAKTANFFAISYFGWIDSGGGVCYNKQMENL